MIRRRSAAWALAVVIGFFLPTSTAGAHASLVSSSPTAGAVLPAAPSVVRLLFTEPVVASLSHVTLIGSNGQPRHLAVSRDPREVRAIMASVAALQRGTYRVDWHIISADGHPVSGEFYFSVGTTGPVPSHIATASHHDSEVALFPATIRGLALSALLALCGLLGFTAYAATPTPAQARIVTVLAVASAALVVAHLAAWMVHVSPSGRIDSVIIEEELSSGAGVSELVRTILVLPTAWAVLLVRRYRIAFPFALAAVIAGGAIGHPAAIVPVIAIPAKALHLAGVAFWMGGLVWLVSSDSGQQGLLRSAAIVSSVALTAIVVVAITGALQGFLFLSGWNDLTGSAYGRAMLGKIAGLLLLAAFGAYHRYRLIPGGKPVGASVRREIAVMIATVMLGGILAHIPAPRTQVSSDPPIQKGTTR